MFVFIHTKVSLYHWKKGDVGKGFVCDFHIQYGWGFESFSGRDIFCLKNFDNFTRTSVSVSKMNAVARAQLAFRMLTILQKYCKKSYVDKRFLI